jgi:hypothetical protein
MSASAPDFYLGWSDGDGSDPPLRCWRVKRLTTPKRRDGLLVVRIEPALPSGPWGRAYLANDVDYILLACHNEGDSLFPIKTFPAESLPVIVARPLVDWEERTQLKADELEVLAWASLYPSEAEARACMTYAHAIKHGKQI